MTVSLVPHRELVRVVCKKWRFAAGLLALPLLVNASDAVVARPLAARSGPRGQTLFAAMPSQRTGVVADNPYDDAKMWAEHYQEFALGSMGSGVAIGDFDNDGRPDIFIVNKTGQCRLFRNQGDWHFEDVTEKAGLMEQGGGGWLGRAKGLVGESAGGGDDHWKQGATFVDVNNDGWLDLYVCRFNAPNLLYVNQHDGTFKEEAAKRGLAIVDGCVAAAFCDYDRDGALDVYVLTNMSDTPKHPDGEADYLLHNNGDGTFTNVTSQAGIGGHTLAHTAVWWDFDNDGWPDLYVTNDFAGADRLYRNNHDGTFTNVIDRVMPHIPDSAMGADFGDINNDGLVDLFVADMASSTHEKDQRGMAVSRELTKEDTATAELPQYQRNALFVNTGTGRMLEAAYLAGIPATDWTWTPRFEDLDNDGRLDLFITNGMSREYQNADLRLRILQAESMDERIKIIRSSPLQRDRHFAFRNLGDLRFEDVGAAWGLNQAGVAFGAASGDLDGDGDLDLVYANYQSGPTLLRNDSDTGHRLVVELRGRRSNRFGIGAVVRIETASGIQVRPLQLLRGYMSSSEPIAHFGLGDETVVQRLVVNWPSGAVQTLDHVAADQRLTITEAADADMAGGDRGGTKPVPGTEQAPALFEDVTASAGLELSAREVFREDLRAQPLAPFRFNRRGPALAVGDVNGDGAQDLVLGATSNDPARVLVAKAGRFSAQPLPPSGSKDVPDGPILVFDADGDGVADLFVTKAGTTLPDGSAGYQPHLWLGDGHAGFHEAADALPALPISAGALAAADFNRDGKVDVFLGGRVVPGKYPLPARSALLANRGGKFEDVTSAVAPELANIGLVTSALWSDVDGDGWPDLLLTLEWGQVRCFHNERGERLVDWTEKAGFAAAGTGWWTSIAAGDFNEDGRPDFIVGNVGLNTQYHATPERPTLLYYGSFGATVPLAIEAYYEGDKLYPRRTRNDLGKYIPAVKQRFRRNDLYARSTLAEILGEPALQAARRFAATELRSGVFLSRPDGTYEFRPLPRVAQIAPLQGVVVGDFDGDGHIDAYAVENSYAPIAWIGHFDGGLGQLLRGDGTGSFEPVTPRESGLVVPGDAKALVLADQDDDGRPEFVVSRNNDTLRAFRGRPIAGRRWLRVDLHGHGGNATGIGARVELALASGRSLASEVYAGSGYYSQSAPEVFFAMPEGATPSKVTVRWPTGEVTTHPVAVGASKLTITQP